MKIASIITKCDQCPHFIKTNADSTIRFGICDYQKQDPKTGEVLKEKTFIVIRATEPVGRFDLTIPDECPLEDYEPTPILI